MKKKYLFILSAIIIIIVLFKLLYPVTNENDNIDLDEYYSENPKEDNDKLILIIQDIIRYGSEGNLEKLSHYVSYPIWRPYPLPMIKDSSEFMKYANIIWDDSLKNVMKTLKPEDWSSCGWRGYTFKDGEYIWMDGDLITRINYDSKKELLLKEKLIEEEQRMLHPSLQNDIESMWISFKEINDHFYGRIDVMKNKKRRICIYDKSQEISEMPKFVALDSIYDIQGSMHNTYLLFSKDSVTIELLQSYYLESSIEINNKGEVNQYKIDCDYRHNTVPKLLEGGKLY